MLHFRRFWVGTALVLMSAWGCYTSIAETPKIDPGSASGSSSSGSTSGIVDPGGTDACAGSQRPWENHGVTALLPTGGTEGVVFSGDRFFKANFDLATGAALGNVTGWLESGPISELYADAPSDDQGFNLWDPPGITAAYSYGGSIFLINRVRRWVKSGTSWPFVGTVVQDWKPDGSAGPPQIDGSVPWVGPPLASFVSATYFTPNQNAFYVISGDKVWYEKTSDPSPENWSWPNSPDASGYLADTVPWTTAPQVNGASPWSGTGVTAAWYIGTKFFAVSVDKIWSWDGTRWTGTMLKDAPGWSNAPAAGCTTTN